MAQNTTIVVTDEWTLLTDSDVSAITFQNIGWQDIYVQVTASADAPGASEHGLRYAPLNREVNVSLSSLAPGVTSPTRVYARTRQGSAAAVWVSHA